MTSKPKASPATKAKPPAKAAPPTVASATNAKPKSPTISDAVLLKSLRATGGMVYLAAKQLGIAPSTIYRRRDANPVIAQAIESEREELLDIGETALKRAVLAGEGWAVCFLLKCRGKSRGYVERAAVEHSGPDGGPIQHAMTDEQRAERAMELINLAVERQKRAAGRG